MRAQVVVASSARGTMRQHVGPGSADAASSRRPETGQQRLRAPPTLGTTTAAPLEGSATRRVRRTPGRRPGSPGAAPGSVLGRLGGSAAGGPSTIARRPSPLLGAHGQHRRRKAPPPVSALSGGKLRSGTPPRLGITDTTVPAAQSSRLSPLVQGYRQTEAATSRSLPPGAEVDVVMMARMDEMERQHKRAIRDLRTRYDEELEYMHTHMELKENLMSTVDMCCDTLATTVTVLINVPVMSVGLKVVIAAFAILIYALQGWLVYTLYRNGLKFDSDLVGSFIREGYFIVNGSSATECTGDCRQDIDQMFGDTYQTLQANWESDTTDSEVPDFNDMLQRTNCKCGFVFQRGHR